MIGRLSNPAEMLERSRTTAVIALSSLYLLYTAVTSVLSPVPMADTWANHSTRYIAAAITALCLLFVALFPKRVQAIYLLVLGLLLLVAMMEIRSLNLTDTFPLHLGLWLMSHITLTFLIFGTRRGLPIMACATGILLLTLLLSWPQDPYRAADWVTIIITLVASGFAGFQLMRIIEVNLLAQQETTLALKGAYIDALTRLPGRAALSAELESSLLRSRTQGQPLSLAICDIDHFKEVNDRFGHQGGDTILYQFGQRLRALLEIEGAVVGRWGGEEFMVILANCSPTIAQPIMDRFRQSLELHPLAEPPITVSIGLSTSLGGTQSAALLFREADAALYTAKRRGRNQVRVFEMEPAAVLENGGDTPTLPP